MAASDIRDAIIAKASELGRFNRIAKVRSPQLQPEHLPILMVYISREVLKPDGDDNVAELRFKNSVTITLSIVRGFDMPDALDDQSNIDQTAIEDSLFRDPEFNVFDLFEGIEGIDRHRVPYQTGETYLDELRTEITFRIREDYEPIIPDDFKSMVITAKPLGHIDAPPITLKIDLP